MHTKRKRLLLADDQESIRDSLGRLLRREGYDVVTVASGAEAVARSIHERLDLVLLDLSMPGMNGWEALGRISEARPELPVVIITAHTHQRPWVEPAGAWALLEKPLDVSLLLATLRALMGEPPFQPASRTPFAHHLPRPPHEEATLRFGSALSE